MDLLRPIGELVAISQPNKPHKAFLSVLVHCHRQTVLLVEVALSYRMRRFIVLITDSKLPFPTDFGDLEKFVYTSGKTVEEAPEEMDTRSRFTHDIPKEAKGKEVEVDLRATQNQDREKETWQVCSDCGPPEWRPRRTMTLAVR